MMSLYLEAFLYFGTLAGMWMLFAGIEKLVLIYLNKDPDTCEHRDYVTNIIKDGSKKTIYKHICKTCKTEWEYTPIHLHKKSAQNSKTKKTKGKKRIQKRS